jgi:hypothetical protein
MQATGSAGSHDSHGRCIQLCISGDVEPEVLLELSEDEITKFSASDIVSQLRESF